MGQTYLEERQDFADFENTSTIILVASAAFIAQLTTLFIGIESIDK